MTEAVTTADSTRSIALTKGLYAIVDECDYGHLSKYKWHSMRRSGRWYASRTDGSTGKNKTIAMHTEIMGKKEGFEIDHRNGNGLDNRRSNLRFATHLQNVRNCRKKENWKISKYKGVDRNHGKRWRARICVKGKKIVLGSFDTEIEAARAYDKAAIENFGEFANINFDYTEDS